MYGLGQLNGSWGVGGPVDAFWILFYCLLGAAALHPSMGQLTALAVQAASHGSHPAATHSAASLIAPCDGILQMRLGRVEGVAVHGIFSAVLFGLVMLRMSGIVRAHQQAIARERDLRTAGAALVAANDEQRVATAART